MAENPLPQSADFSVEPKEGKTKSPVAGPTPHPREFPRTVPTVKRLLNERFGKATLRELSEKLGLDDVTPQLLSSSIAGNGAKRVRLAIAKALGEDPDALWPMARH
jgi:lambda repressor-like predicted transcriptional regulator